MDAPSGERLAGPTSLRHRPAANPEANARLTPALGALLLALLAVEGVTLLEIRRLLVLHVFLGLLVVPPVILKVASATWRAARYYLGSPQYRR
jgi:hypothetical protein